MTTIVGAIREGRLDAELAALAWLVAEGGMPVHVAGDHAARADDLVLAVRALGGAAADVSTGPGASLEDVLRQPVPIRPATGVVLVLDADGRVGAAHLHRPPLRDGAGHVRPQGPAVLAVRDAGSGGWEHFAWGVTPELADAVGRRAGDFEIELDRRAVYLAGLVAGGLERPDEVTTALAGYRSATSRTGDPPHA